MVIFKSKNINLIALKILFLKNDVDTDNILITKKLHLAKETINISLVIQMIIKLNHLV